MARIVIREQDLTGNRVDQNFTDIALIPGFVKYPKQEFDSPQLCYSEQEFIDKFGNEPAVSYSRFEYRVQNNGDDITNPETGSNLFYLTADETESVSDCAYHYARELLYRGLPIYYWPINKREESEPGEDLGCCYFDGKSRKSSGKMIPYDGTQNSQKEPISYKNQPTYDITNLERTETISNGYVALKFDPEIVDEDAHDIVRMWLRSGVPVEKATDIVFKPEDGFDLNTNYTAKVLYKVGSGEEEQEVVLNSQAVKFDESALPIKDQIPHAKWTILYKDSADETHISTQGASEKFYSIDSGEPRIELINGVQEQITTYNYQAKFNVQVAGYGVDSFSYKWYMTDAEDDWEDRKLISTSKVCSISGLTYTKPNENVEKYIWVEIYATPTSAKDLGTINITTTTDMYKVIALARVKAIAKANEVTQTDFTGEMLDFFSDDANTELIKDRGLYNFKYLTTGGYPLFEAATLTSDGSSVEFTNWRLALTKLLEVCGQKTVDDSKDFISEEGVTTRQGRGDCVLLIDHMYDKCQDTMDLYADAREYFEDPANVNDDALEFAAMFTPWCNYGMTYTNKNIDVNLPASFAYLSCLADSIQSYDNWNAIAGVTRGTVKNINEVLLTNPLTNTKANKCQADPETAERGRISINCITEVKPYGQVIWGNRTLQKADQYKHVTAMGFLNLRNEVSDIKKLVYRAARRWMFEQNTSILWVNFKSTITPLLEKMVSGYGLTRYEIRRGEQTAKHKLYAEIRIWPIYAVEYIDVTIQILDEDTIVTEE